MIGTTTAGSLVMLCAFIIVITIVDDSDACGFGGGGGGGGCGCGGGGGGCGRRKRDTQSPAAALVTSIDGNVEDRLPAPRATNENSQCNSRPISRIIEKYISEDEHKSKTSIHNALHEILGGFYIVFCSDQTVEFSSDSIEYCSGGKGKFTCNVLRVE